MYADSPKDDDCAGCNSSRRSASHALFELFGALAAMALPVNALIFAQNELRVAESAFQRHAKPFVGERSEIEVCLRLWRHGLSLKSEPAQAVEGMCVPLRGLWRREGTEKPTRHVLICDRRRLWAAPGDLFRQSQGARAMERPQVAKRMKESQAAPDACDSHSRQNAEYVLARPAWEEQENQAEKRLTKDRRLPEGMRGKRRPVLRPQLGKGRNPTMGN
jgi:hypothetical protein